MATFGPFIHTGPIHVLGMVLSTSTAEDELEERASASLTRRIHCQPECVPF